MKVFNYSELHFAEVTFYKIHTLAILNSKYVHVFVRVANLGPESSKGSNHS